MIFSDLNIRIFHGNASNMDVLGKSEADLVITSPPYFPESVSLELAQPRKDQKNINQIEKEILSFARTFRPVFQEIRRVLKPERALIIQTKDIRYGEFIIPLSDAHLSVAASCDFHLISRFIWVPKFSHYKRSPKFIGSKKVGQFKVFDGETFLIMSLKIRNI